MAISKEFSIDIILRAFDKTENVLKGTSKNFEGFRKRMEEAITTSSKFGNFYRETFNDFAQVTTKAGSNYKKLSDIIERKSQAAKIHIESFSEEIKRLNNLKATRIKNELGSISQSVDEARKSFDRLNTQMTKVITVGRDFATLGAVVGALGIGIVKVSADFEHAMSGVKAVTTDASAQFEELNEKASELGRTTRYTAVQAAEGMKLLGMAGLDASEVMKAISPTLNLAAAGNMDLAQTADIATNVMAGFGLEASDLEHVVDVLANTSTSTNATIETLGTSMSYAANMAASAGMSVDEAAAAIGILHTNGIKGSRAGTALRGVLASLAKPSNVARRELKKLGVEISTNEDGTIRLLETLRDLKAANMDISSATALFRRRAAGAALALVDYTDQMENLTHANESATNSGQRLADTMLDNLIGSLIKLKSAFLGVLQVLGKPFLGSLKFVADRLTEFLSSIGDLLDAFPLVSVGIGSLIATFSVLATGIGVVLIAVGKLAIVIGAAKLAMRLYSAAIKQTAIGLELYSFATGQAAKANILLAGSFKSLSLATKTFIITAIIADVYLLYKAIKELTLAWKAWGDVRRRADQQRRDLSLEALDNFDLRIKKASELKKLSEEEADAYQHRLVAALEFWVALRNQLDAYGDDTSEADEKIRGLGKAWAFLQNRTSQSIQAQRAELKELQQAIDQTIEDFKLLSDQTTDKYRRMMSELKKEVLQKATNPDVARAQQLAIESAQYRELLTQAKEYYKELSEMDQSLVDVEVIRDAEKKILDLREKGIQKTRQAEQMLSKFLKKDYSSRISQIESFYDRYSRVVAASSAKNIITKEQETSAILKMESDKFSMMYTESKKYADEMKKLYGEESEEYASAVGNMTGALENLHEVRMAYADAYIGKLNELKDAQKRHASVQEELQDRLLKVRRQGMTDIEKYYSKEEEYSEKIAEMKEKEKRLKELVAEEDAASHKQARKLIKDLMDLYEENNRQISQNVRGRERIIQEAEEGREIEEEGLERLIKLDAELAKAEEQRIKSTANKFKDELKEIEKRINKISREIKIYAKPLIHQPSLDKVVGILNKLRNDEVVIPVRLEVTKIVEEKTIKKAVGGLVDGYADGGRVFNHFPRRQGRVPGIGDEDTVPAALTPGEYILKKDAVRHYGAGIFSLFNNLKFPVELLPKFEEGGFVGNFNIDTSFLSNASSSLSQKGKKAVGRLVALTPRFADGSSDIDSEINRIQNQYDSYIQQAKESGEELRKIWFEWEKAQLEALAQELKQRIEEIQETKREAIERARDEYTNTKKDIKEEIDKIDKEIEDQGFIKENGRWRKHVSTVFGLTAKPIKSFESVWRSPDKYQGRLQEMLQERDDKVYIRQLLDAKLVADRFRAEQKAEIDTQLAKAEYEKAVIETKQESMEERAEIEQDTIDRIRELEEDKNDLLRRLAGVESGSGSRSRGGFSGFRAYLNKGGTVPGFGDKDTVPAMLTPGEFVLNKDAVRGVGRGFLQALNNMDASEIAKQINFLPRFADGGPVYPMPVYNNTNSFSSEKTERFDATLNLNAGAASVTTMGSSADVRLFVRELKKQGMLQ